MVNGKVAAALKGEPSPLLCCIPNAERKSKIFFLFLDFRHKSQVVVVDTLELVVQNLNGLDEVTLLSSLCNSDRSRVLQKIKKKLC